VYRGIKSSSFFGAVHDERNPILAQLFS